MSRTNNVNEQLQDYADDIEKVTQLCHEYSNEREDVHKLGFQCLLKKLKEIEKIILAISKMSGNVQDDIQVHQNTVSASKNNNNETNSPSSVCVQPEIIRLPNDLTYHSKLVLHAIYDKFETNIDDTAAKLKAKFHETLNDSFCEMESIVRTFIQEKKDEAKIMIEALLTADIECFEENKTLGQQIILNSQPNTSHGAEKLHLPEDLTPFTRSALNEIFENYEANVNSFSEWIKIELHQILSEAFHKFDDRINGMMQKRKISLKQNLENVFTEHYETNAKIPTKPKDMPISDNKRCVHFDSQLARHFHELSRLVGAILDKNENNASIDVNKVSIVEDADDQIVENEDILDETKYMKLPKFTAKRRRLPKQP